MIITERQPLGDQARRARMAAAKTPAAPRCPCMGAALPLDEAGGADDFVVDLETDERKNLVAEKEHTQTTQTEQTEQKRWVSWWVLRLSEWSRQAR
jgi:hypothetical protein